MQLYAPARGRSNTEHPMTPKPQREGWSAGWPLRAPPSASRLSSLASQDRRFWFNDNMCLSPHCARILKPGGLIGRESNRAKWPEDEPECRQMLRAPTGSFFPSEAPEASPAPPPHTPPRDRAGVDPTEEPIWKKSTKGKIKQRFLEASPT